MAPWSTTWMDNLENTIHTASGSFKGILSFGVQLMNWVSCGVLNMSWWKNVICKWSNRRASIQARRSSRYLLIPSNTNQAHSSAKYVRCTHKIPCATLPMLLWKPTWANQLKIWHCCQVGPLWKICQLLHMRSINHLYECLVGLILQWKHYYIDIQKHLMWLSLKAIVLSNVSKWPSISLRDAADAIEMAQRRSKQAFTMAWNWPTCWMMCCWWPRVASNWCCQ